MPYDKIARCRSCTGLYIGECPVGYPESSWCGSCATWLRHEAVNFVKNNPAFCGNCPNYAKCLTLELK